MGDSTIDGKLIGNENNIVFYTDEENNINIEVILQNENVWLNTQSIAKLFHVQRAGNRNVTRSISYYNLDMVISIGFRVNSKPAIKFRTWANKVIKEYMIKGFVLNDDRFIKGNKIDVKYFDELLERVKTIRVSERILQMV